MTSKELRRKADEKLAAAQNLFSTAASENRNLTEDEQGQAEKFQADAANDEKQAVVLGKIEAQRATYGKSQDAPPVVEIHDRAEDQPWDSFGQHVRAIINYFDPSRGEKRDPRLKLAISGASESVPSDGGILVDKQFAPGILTKIYESGQILSRCARTQIDANSNGLKINGVDESSRATGSRYGGVRGYWIGEADDKTASKPKFEQIEITLRKLASLFYATDELLQDTTALGQLVDKAMRDEMTFLLEDSIIHGDGGVRPLGIMNSPALISVAKEGGQGAATLNFLNIIKMRSRMWSRSLQNSVWLANVDIQAALYTMTLAVGTAGVPVYMPAGGASAAPLDTLFGRPIIYNEYSKTLGTAGDLLLVDLSQYQIIEKGGVQSAMSIHVRFTNDETVMRWVLRVGGKPLWTSTLTPYQGAATLSPYIALDTRA